MLLCKHCENVCETLTNKGLCKECHADEKIFFSYQKPEVVKRFIDLSCRLSPENLTCDGELSRTESRRRYRHLMLEWKKLERRIGRKISEGAVFAYELEQFNKRG
jgi:hypothetical protein